MADAYVLIQPRYLGATAVSLQPRIRPFSYTDLALI